MLVGAAAALWLGRVEFFHPLWLPAALLLIPLAWVAVHGISGLPSRTNAVSMALRSLAFLLLVFCLADIQMVRRNDGLSVLFLLDHSASIPESVREKELQYAVAATRTKGKKDTAGLVVFGENASVEMMPGPKLEVDRIYSSINRDYTSLQTAVELATAAFPADTRRKIVLITDGNENKGDIMEAARSAAGRQVVLDVLPVSYDYNREVLVEKVHLPDRIKENETFDLRVHLLALQDGPSDLVIYRNGRPVARETLDLRKGRNTYTAAMKIDEPGFYAFSARISGQADTIARNNEAAGYVYIQGMSRVLFVAPDAAEVAHLVQACRAENLEADVMTPEEFPESLGALQNHDCIVLANVPAEAFSQNQMAMLQANVRDLGAGLIMIGGQNSFGAGGYEKTPIEEALPVTMDIKQKKINPKGALVLILHTCEFPDGNYWAKQISKKAIETVNSQDDVGVLLYGGKEEWLFPLQPAADKKAMYAKIDLANPGDMPSFEPTFQLAFAALSKSDAMVRHVIVISDGDPSAPSPQLVKDMAAAKITISTIGINPHSPRDVQILSYIAAQTGGRYYFAEDPAALPAIFVKEAKVVKRSLIFNKKFQPLLVLSTELTKGVTAADVPPLMAYVATTPKTTALVPLVSDNENHDPILAYWQYGLGKSLAFTGDACGNWAKEWVTWDKFNKLWSQLIRWTARKREKSNLVMRTETQGDRGRLVIDAVDPQGQFLNFLKLNGRLVTPDNKGTPLEIRQTAPGRYEAEFDARQVGVSIINVGYQDPRTGGQGFAATGVSVPYSPEYLTLASHIGLLRRAADAADGALLSGDPEKDRVFHSRQPPSRSFRPLWESLMMAALALFFLDIVVRRVVVTRDDIAAAGMAIGTAIRARFSFRHGAGDSTRTMAALLQRKKKTFEEKAPAGPPGKFKETLDQAAGASQAPAALPLADAEPAPAAPAPTPSPAKPAKVTSPAATPAAGAADDSYTGRLLAAKKRARAKSSEEGNKEEKE